MYLIVERPNQQEETYLYDDAIKLRFNFDVHEQKQLETGKVVWRGDIAFTLENE